MVTLCVEKLTEFVYSFLFLENCSLKELKTEYKKRGLFVEIKKVNKIYVTAYI